MIVISVLLKSSLKILNMLGVLVSAGLIGACSFIVLAWSAMNEVNILNRWARDYLI